MRHEGGHEGGTHVELAEALVLVGDLLEEGAVRALGHADLLVQKGDDAREGLLNNIQHDLVVGELNLLPLHPLLLILGLLRLEQVLYKLPVQLLVRIVNTKLLQRVDLKLLKA